MSQTFVRGKPCWFTTNCPCDDCEHFTGMGPTPEPDTCKTCIGEGPYSGTYDYRHFKNCEDNEDGA